VTAFYVVACTDPPTDPWAGVRERLAAVAPVDLLDQIHAALGPESGLAIVPSSAAPPIRWDLAACFGGDERAVARGRAAPWHVLVRCPGRPARSMSHEWAALAVARAIQAETRGVLVDVAVDRVLARFVRSARQADALDLDRRELVSTWTWVLYSPDDDGTFWLTTDGLQRYGLPELSLHGIPAGQINDGRFVLMGLAHRIVLDQSSEIGGVCDPPSFRVIPRHWAIARRDMEAAYPDGTDVGWMVDDRHVTLVETAHDVTTGVPMLEVVFDR
jgi:hypothetical protein